MQAARVLDFPDAGGRSAWQALQNRRRSLAWYNGRRGGTSIAAATHPD